MKTWQIVLIIVVIAVLIFGFVAYSQAQKRKQLATQVSPVVTPTDERKNIWEIISGITGVIGTSSK